jgi:glycosyltransferase involved in cell wall biosynthesis
VAYIGNFKDNQNVPDLWESIQSLNESEPDFKELFRLKITGSVGMEVRSSITNAGLLDQTDFYDFVAHQEATKRMAEASLLLFVIPRSERNKLILTGKIFEYLASRTPMFSIGPIDGNAASILEECDRSKMMEYEDGQSILEGLQGQFRNWKANGKENPSVSTEAHMIYSRQAQTEQLVQVLNTLSK